MDIPWAVQSGDSPLAACGATGVANLANLANLATFISRAFACMGRC
jgi:hypothetical protein